MTTATVARPAGSPVPGVGRRGGRRIAVGVVVALVLGTEAVLAGPYLSSATTAVTHAADRWVALAVLAAAGSLTAFGLVRRRLLRAAGVRVSTGSALASILVANAFHMTLPGGVAFSTGYAVRWMQRRGAGMTVAGWNLAVNGLLSTAGLAALGLSASVLVGTTSWVRLAIEILGVAVLVLGVGRLVRHPHRVLAAAGRALAVVNRVRRRPADAGISRIGEIADQLRAVRPTAADWATAAGYALLNWLLDLGCLAACAHAVGLTDVGTAGLLAAYVTGMAASSVSVLPGGLGAVDAALVVGLVTAGAPAAAALSAVVLYRLISLVGVVVVGWVVHAVQTADVGHASSPTHS